MKRGHEYIDINGYLYKPEGACSGFKAEGHSTAQASPTCYLGTPRCIMKGGHEYIDITEYLYEPGGARSGLKLRGIRPLRLRPHANWAHKGVT